MAMNVPPGWPASVQPPDRQGFEPTAVSWLLDVVPPDYRLHDVLRQYPLALALLARHHLRACQAGTREGYRMARTDLGGALPPHAIGEVLAAYREETRRLQAAIRATDLLIGALRHGRIRQPLQRPWG
jgi:hypothetical protein